LYDARAIKPPYPTLFIEFLNKISLLFYKMLFTYFNVKNI